MARERGGGGGNLQSCDAGEHEAQKGIVPLHPEQIGPLCRADPGHNHISRAQSPHTTAHETRDHCWEQRPGIIDDSTWQSCS